MSLDVYLINRKCKACGKGDEEFWQNITHNLGEMAGEAGIYEAVWRPDENGIVKAKQLIPILEKGITEMETKPEHFKKFDSPNGWGSYENFLPWLRKYLEACRSNPDAEIEVCR